MTCGKTGDADDVHVLLDRSAGDCFGRLFQTGEDHLHARLTQRVRHHGDTDRVRVHSELGEKDAQRARRQLSAWISHARELTVRRVHAEDIAQGVTYFPVGGVDLDRRQTRRHEIAAGACGCAYGIECRRPRRCCRGAPAARAAGPPAPPPCVLAARKISIWRFSPGGHQVIHTHPFAPPRFDILVAFVLLAPERALEIAALDGAQRSTHRAILSISARAALSICFVSVST